MEDIKGKMLQNQKLIEGILKDSAIQSMQRVMDRVRWDGI